MQDGCKVYMDSYMTSNGSCFMVTWTNFKNHLLEVGLYNFIFVRMKTSTMLKYHKQTHSIVMGGANRQTEAEKLTKGVDFLSSRLY
jgi:hypothetical protein